ncbi:MAG: DUF1801 domain-containing protein [Bacteroidota bacterium]
MAKKVEIKTKRTNASVAAFISSVKDPAVRKDLRTISALMKKTTRSKPAMWGPSIVGFGSVTLHYSTGRELDWMLCGFSPRKQALTLYLSTGFPFKESLMKKLGKHKHGMGCLYIKSLSDVDLKVLEQIIAASVATMKKMYGAKR